MTTRTIFDAIWGDAAGTRVIGTKKLGGVWKDTAYATNDEALQGVRDAVESGRDCYFAPHLFAGERRRADEAIGCSAFYLDIDIKPDNPKCYATAADALQSLKIFLVNTGLPEPTIVDSGNGFHVYWVLDTLLPLNIWSESARQLKTLCRTQGLKADAAVTADAARVLRVPESRNYKDGGDGKPCVVLTTVRSYDPADIPLTSALPIQFHSNINDAFLAGIDYASDDARNIARLCLPHLNRARCDDYEGWLCAGIALYRVFNGQSEGFDLWDGWSRQSAVYEQGACSEKWEGFGSDRSEALGVGSLVHWAQQDSAEFRDIWEAHKADKRVQDLAAKSDAILLTDLGNSQRLAVLHGDDIRYDFPRRVWYVWTGTLWKENAEPEIRQLAAATVKSMYSEAASLADESRRTALAKHAARSEAAGRLKAMIELVESRPELQASVVAFDAHPHLMSVANGVLDLRSGSLLPHAREFMLSKCVPLNYDPRAECPTFQSFLKRIFAGNETLIEYLRRAVGYTLTGETSEQVFFICYGEGANGKSTLLETIHGLLGDLASTIRTDALMQQRFASSAGHNEDVANLLGARYVSASETESGQHLAESAIKQLTGGDTITASRKYGRAFKFQPSFKLWLACNHRPQITGTDAGIWRRIRLIPFSEFIPESERDPKLKNKLAAEMSGILTWAVKGSAMWYAKGLGTSPDIESATHAYRSEQDTVERFLLECCETGAGFSVVPNLLYENYKQWCLDNGAEYLNRLQFPAEMQRRGFVKGQTKGIGGVPMRGWRDIRLKSVMPFSNVEVTV